MRRTNIEDPAFEYDQEDPDGFRTGMLRVGPGLGASRLGASVYELPPGQAVCPYHYEYGEEEWLLVLQGAVTLRTPAGTEELHDWDLTCFPPGPQGAPQVRNDGGGTARVLMFSTLSSPAAAVYPDSDKIAIFTGNPDDDVMVRRTSGVGYYEGESA